MSDRTWKTIISAVAVVGVVLLGGIATYFESSGPEPSPPVAGEGITVEAPGSRAAAYTELESSRYDWTVWLFRAGDARPAEVEKSEDGRRIQFEAEKGAIHAISLTVEQGIYHEVWEYEGEDKPPPPPPQLEGLALLAYTWASEMSSEARGEAPRIAGNFRSVGGKLSGGQYGTEWLAATNAAIAELKQLNDPRHADWDGWLAKWSGEMNNRLTDGRLAKSPQAIGQSFGEIADGLSQVREFIQPWINQRSSNLRLGL